MRKLSAGLVVVLALVAFAACTVPAPPGTVHTPTSKSDCKRGGWRTHTDEHGNLFAGRRQCIRWVKHHPVVTPGATLGDLAGIVDGNVLTDNTGCATHQVFEGVYEQTLPTPPPDYGVVTFRMDGCLPTTIDRFDGTFAIDSALGRVSGPAVGTVVTGSGINYDVDLTVATATGAFEESVGGVLHVRIPWSGAQSFQGTVSLPS